MTVNILILVLIVGLAVLLGGLTHKAWKPGRPLLKWVGVLLSGLLTLVVTLVSVLGIVGVYKFYNPPHNPVKEAQVAGTSE